jgi:hypothetical protein
MSHVCFYKYESKLNSSDMFWCTPIITNVIEILLEVSRMKRTDEHTDGQTIYPLLFQFIHS